MRREIQTWLSALFFMLLLALSACESAPVFPKPADREPYKKTKQQNRVYDIMTKSSGKLGDERRNGKMHVVRHLKVSEKAKGTYGGASDLKRPKTSHSAASSFLGTSLFSSPLICRVTIGCLIFALFY